MIDFARRAARGKVRIDREALRCGRGDAVSVHEFALYPSLLGARWAVLEPHVRRLHESGTGARGTFRVRRGAKLGARLLATAHGMPPAAETVEVSLRVERTARGERWTRSFGGRSMVTTQWRRGDLLVEAMGPVQCWFRLDATGGALVFEQVKATLGGRRCAVRLPRWIAPRVTAREEQRVGAVHVSVRIGAPVVGLIVSYEGDLTPEAGP
jgi:hypothetical protein